MTIAQYSRKRKRPHDVFDILHATRIDGRPDIACWMSECPPAVTSQTHKHHCALANISHTHNPQYHKPSITSSTLRKQRKARCVAISGLEARIARAIGCESRYGIFQRYLHRNLLWQRSDGKKTKRIGYETSIVPSWSWMAYDGGIQFIDIPFSDVDWIENLRFNGKHKHALVTDVGVGVFRNCSLEPTDTSYAILDSRKVERVERGWIQYDIKASGDLHDERCVVVGREFYGMSMG